MGYSNLWSEGIIGAYLNTVVLLSNRIGRQKFIRLNYLCQDNLRLLNLSFLVINTYDFTHLELYDALDKRVIISIAIYY